MHSLVYYTLMSARTPSRINLTAPTNYRILQVILTSKEPFLQRDVANMAHAQPTQVSRIVRWLETHEHVTRRKEDGLYEVTAPASLVIALMPYQRKMSDSLAGTVKVREELDKVAGLLVKEGATLCLESALSVYSEYFRPDRLAVYHPDPKGLLSRLAPNEGGFLPVSVYMADIPLEGDVEGPDSKSPLRRTTKFRTLVDLLCDNRAYAAKDLFLSLWGVRFG